VGALVHLVDESHGLAVEQRPGPSASLESAAAVLIRPAVSLHHSIDGDLRDGRQFHDRGSLLLGGALVGRPLTPATKTSALIRHPRPGSDPAPGIRNGRSRVTANQLPPRLPPPPRAACTKAKNPPRPC